MNETVTSRGLATRQANKAKRREKILGIARELISNKGFEAFTLQELAAKADVTVPTIHNLFGKKADIFRELVEQMVLRVQVVLTQPQMTDPILAAQAFIDNLLDLFKEDESFYKAAFLTGERTRLFEHELPTGIFHQSLKLAQQVCANGVKQGYLQGKVDNLLLAKQLFGCQRLARQDWMYGYIDLKEYRVQVLQGMYLTFMADASEAFRKQLLGELAGFESG